jgi:hypothetical protein
MPSTRSHLWILVLPILVFVPIALTGALAGSVSLPHAFAPGTVADANQVNANFEALADEVNDNHGRLRDLETATHPVQIHVSPGGLGVFLGLVTRNAYGLSWPDDVSDAAFVFLHRPADHAGGDVTVQLTLMSDYAEGTVDFFLRAASREPGEDWSYRTQVSGVPVDMSKGDVFTLHVQEIELSGDLLQAPLWMFSIHRSSDDLRDTSTHDVSLLSVDLVYEGR